MKDFDDERHQRAFSPEEREFKAGGREWRARSGVRPEAMARFNDLLARIRANAVAAEGQEPVSDDVVVAVLDQVIRDCIEQHGEEWDEVRQAEAEPITLETLWGIATFVVEAVSGRPLQRPSDSGDTQSEPSTQSTLDSSSPAGPALKLST